MVPNVPSAKGAPSNAISSRRIVTGRKKIMRSSSTALRNAIMDYQDKITMVIEQGIVTGINRFAHPVLRNTPVPVNDDDDDLAQAMDVHAFAESISAFVKDIIPMIIAQLQ